MDRRDFLRSTGGALAAVTLAERLGAARPPGPASGPVEPDISTGAGLPGGGRLVLSMNRNWRFSPTRSLNDTARQFDDSQFEQVTIPHTNKRLPWHSFDETSYQFVSIYRRRFKVPAEARGHHVFVDFDGAMTAATMTINDRRLGEYKGGYTPFSFELTPYLDWTGENVLAVELDSRERPDIPPFGGSIDYLTFGGIYRDVRLRVVPATHLENIVARPVDVLTDKPGVNVVCFVQHLDGTPAPTGLILEAQLRDGEHILGTARAPLQRASAPTAGTASAVTIALRDFGPIQRWDLSHPHLYSVVARITSPATRGRPEVVMDEDRRRFGFRQAQFTEHGFELNGRVVKLRGLNRHQTFPWVGQAMPARVQRRDAYILRRELKCNIVRTSHYPQSPHFLDACDEVGLLVLEEIPGWQHTGDEAWQDLAVDNVQRMIRRDWNHPSIVLWGVRINEARDNHAFYTRTNEIAHTLDPTRQTGGIRNNYKSELLEDVFTMNDFDFPLQPPNHPRYLNTEFIGHTYPTKMNDTSERLTEHALRHARVHNQIGSSPQYTGGIGWCAFDYDTHGNFGSGDRICYHGVSDIFRLPKPAAFFYRSQCDPAEEVVLEPAFQWSARADWSNIFQGHGVVFSNCDHLKLYVGDRLFSEADPDRETFPNLPHPPFKVMLNRAPYADLRIEGYIGGKKVVERNYSGRGLDRQFLVTPDDMTLVADGADATRIVLRVADEFGTLRRWSTAAIALSLEGPADIIGDNPFSLVGGCGAIWVRARQEPGTVYLKATHPVLGTQEIEIRIAPAEAERV